MGYQILWMRLLGIALGNETLGVAGLLIGFFGGLAIGAAVFDGIIKRSEQPALLFAVLEAVIAVYALGSPFFIRSIAGVLPLGTSSIGTLLLTVCAGGLVLLPATLCMGGTLAALVAARQRATDDPAVLGKGVGRLYASNTAGAMVGSLGATYFILPRSGFIGGAVLLGATGLTSAVLALVWNRRHPAQNQEPDLQSVQTAGSFSAKHYLLLLFGTGVIGIGLETTAIYVLSQILQNTVYTYTHIVAVYLFGTALGAWFYQRFVATGTMVPRDKVAGVLLGALMLSMAGMAAVLTQASLLFESVASPLDPYINQIFGEIVLTTAVFLVPTMIMGALFSHLMTGAAAAGVGKAYSINLLGSALAPVLVSVMAVKYFGYGGSLRLLTVAAGFLLLFHEWRRTEIYRKIAILIMGVVFLLVLFPKEMNLISVPAGWTSVMHKESPLGVVSVIQAHDPAFGGHHSVLKVNQHCLMGGNRSLVEKRMGHMAMLMHPAPQRALFLGIGAGTTLSASQQYGLQTVDAVEIIPEVLEALPFFDGDNGNLSQAENICFHTADARRYIAHTTNRYDVVVADLYHPDKDGAAFLYSKNHYKAIQETLNADGVFVQMIPLYQFDEANLKMVIRTFLSVFEHAHGFLGSFSMDAPVLLLVGKTAGSPLELNAVKISMNLFPGKDASLVIENIRDFLASHVATRSGLRAYAGDGSLNTDLNPLMLFHLPRFSLTEKQKGNAPLEALLEFREPFPVRGLVRSTPEFIRRSTMTWEAAGWYLKGELQRLSAGGIKTEKQLLYHIRAHRIDPDFSPARGFLLYVVDSRPELKPFIEDQLRLLHRNGYE